MIADQGRDATRSLTLIRPPPGAAPVETHPRDMPVSKTLAGQDEASVQGIVDEMVAGGFDSGIPSLLQRTRGLQRGLGTWLPTGAPPALGAGGGAGARGPGPNTTAVLGTGTGRDQGRVLAGMVARKTGISRILPGGS